MAYGDEIDAQGSSAYVGRPSHLADRTQYLPLIRANYSGYSLIAIANVSSEAVDVNIEYKGAAASAAGAGQIVTQEFSVPYRGSAFIDLSDRGRGSRPAASLPQGSGSNDGFLGSATIHATGPILAVVQDEQMRDGHVDSVSAYSAFGPRDLGSEFSATSVRRMWDYQSTSIVVHNPGYDTVSVAIDIFDSSDRNVGQLSAEIEERSMHVFALADAGSVPAGVGRAYVRADGSIAVLVCDERDARGEPLVKQTTAYVHKLGDSRVSGGARLTEAGTNLTVEIDLNYVFEGSTYFAGIVSGPCDGDLTEVHELNDFVDKNSYTVLQNVSIESLTTSVHSILVKVAGFRGRPPRDVACGEILPLLGPDVVDTAISWPVKMAEGAAIVSPTPPEATATETPPGPTSTPSPTPRNLGFKVYLPKAYRQ
jgi:hypothetical protein